MSIKQVIDERKEALGMTLNQVHVKSGIPYAVLNRIYNGQPSAEFKTLRALARTLGVSIDALLEESPTIRPQMDTAMKEIVEGAEQLDAADRHTAARYVRWLKEQKKKT